MSALVLVLALAPAISLGRTILTSNGDPVSARVAEWARGNGLGFLVTLAEEIAYRAHPPRVGGTPDPALLSPTTRAPGAGSTTGPSSTTGATRSSGSTSVRGRAGQVFDIAPIPSIAHPALRGEGVFRTVATVGGRTAVALAYLRPDSVHTSFLAAVTKFNSAEVRFVLHPGSSEPGHLQLWTQPDWLPPAARAGLLATFNSGFKLADARGGFYADGHTVGRLEPQAASLVIDQNGRLQIGAWGSEVTMRPAVASVRQNLRLLIDHGAVAGNLTHDTQSAWGATIGGAAYVWRSGVGVDRQGNVINVVGESLSVHSLATILRHAGAVRAMELDINPLWTSTMTYRHSHGQTIADRVIDFRRPAERYFSPSTRDFVAVYAR